MGDNFEGDQIVPSGVGLVAPHMNQQVESKKLDAQNRQFLIAFDGYCDSSNNSEHVNIRLLKICDRSSHCFYIGFEVSDSLPNSSSHIIITSGLEINQPPNRPTGADWTYIREARYTGINPAIPAKTFVVILL